MRKIFEEELQDLHVLFSEMGKMVNEAIYISVKGFVNHDKELAAEVIAHDVAINQREAEIEKRCFELIALHQPVTGNLRRIVTIMKACADLERMADHAVSIAKSTIRVKGNKRNSDIEAAIAEQSEKVKVMVEEVLAAYIKTDIEKAKEVALSDIEEMKLDPELVLGATDYIMVAGYLERIGDYVTNICEWIIYLGTGKIIELNTNNKFED